MSGQIIFSFDCEGKWGVADQLNARVHAELTESRLRSAYREIIHSLDKYSIPATFAFVGLFTLSYSGLELLSPAFQNLRNRAPHYLGAALDDALGGTREGWIGDWALQQVGAARIPHEVGLHGVTHVPWASVDAAFAREEMSIFVESGGELSRSVKTFVYPRNAVAHEYILGEFGIRGYRGSRQFPNRLLSLLSELDPFSLPDPVPIKKDMGEVTPIPPGYFVNWLSGIRALIPIEASRARARAIMMRAAKTGTVAHFWSHPENIASSPATMDLLGGIFEDAARLRDAGTLDIVTQKAFLDRLDRPLVGLQAL